MVGGGGKSATESSPVIPCLLRERQNGILELRCRAASTSKARIRCIRCIIIAGRADAKVDAVAHQSVEPTVKLLCLTVVHFPPQFEQSYGLTERYS